MTVLMVAVFIFRRHRVKQTPARMSKSFSNRRWTSKNGGSKLATLMDDKATELCLQAFGIAPRPRVAKLG